MADALNELKILSSFDLSSNTMKKKAGQKPPTNAHKLAADLRVRVRAFPPQCSVHSSIRYLVVVAV